VRERYEIRAYVRFRLGSSGASGYVDGLLDTVMTIDFHLHGNSGASGYVDGLLDTAMTNSKSAWPVGGAIIADV